MEYINDTGDRSILVLFNTSTLLIDSPFRCSPHVVSLYCIFFWSFNLSPGAKR